MKASLSRPIINITFEGEKTSPSRNDFSIWINTDAKTWGFEDKHTIPAFFDAKTTDFINNIINKVCEFQESLKD